MIKNNYIDTSEGEPQSFIAATGIIYYNDANWHTTPTAYSVDGAVVQDNYIYQVHNKDSIWLQDVNGSVTIKGNKIDATLSGHGLCLGATSTLGFHMDVSGTVIEDNEWQMGGGIGIQLKRVTTSSSPVSITGNNITGAGKGVRLWCVGSETVIQGNTITNGAKGIEIGRSGSHTVNNVSILSNDILDNDIGIHIISGDLGTGNEAHFNNIVGNNQFGVRNDDPALFDAENNWWGDVSGPSGSYGTGDKVSANVDYDPWLDAPYPDGQSINFTGAQTNTTGTGTTEIDAKVNASTTVTINTTAPVNVTIAEYSRNPGSGFGGDIGKYIDVHINDTTNVTNITIKLFYTDADIGGLNENTLRMRWWNSTIGEWVACSNTGVNTTDQNGYSGYIWAYIDQTTTPSLSELTGAPFGGQGSLPERVPVLTPIGLLALIGILSAVLAVAVATSRKKKSK